MGERPGLRRSGRSARCSSRPPPSLKRGSRDPRGEPGTRRTRLMAGSRPPWGDQSSMSGRFAHEKCCTPIEFAQSIERRAGDVKDLLVGADHRQPAQHRVQPGGPRLRRSVSMSASCCLPAGSVPRWAPHHRAGPDAVAAIHWIGLCGCRCWSSPRTPNAPTRCSAATRLGTVARREEAAGRPIEPAARQSPNAG